MKMFNSKQLIALFSILFMGLTQAQTVSVVDCSTVLIVPENSTLAIDTTVDITMDSLWNTQSNFEIMLIVEVSDSASVNKVHIDLGPTANDSTLLHASYNSSNNTAGSTHLIYEPYSDFINIKVGEFTIDNVLHYRIRLEDADGNFSVPHLGTIAH